MDKPKRGNCGTCHWWEFTNIIKAPDGSDVRNGLCLVNPPTPVLMNVPVGSSLQPGPPKIATTVQAMCPPQTELGRCSQWIPAGTFPEKLQ